MKMRDVEHAAGLFMNGLAAAFYEIRLSGFQVVRLSPIFVAVFMSFAHPQ